MNDEAMTSMAPDDVTDDMTDLKTHSRISRDLTQLTSSWAASVSRMVADILHGMFDTTWHRTHCLVEMPQKNHWITHWFLQSLVWTVAIHRILLTV